jgi:hypothetical protein
MGAAPILEKRMDHQAALEMLMDSSVSMHEQGVPFMRRVLPAEEETRLWAHYPENDVVNGPLDCRYFYHCHPPEERTFGEHGHFHIFFGKSAMSSSVKPMIPAPKTKVKRADVVHIAALSVDTNGLPVRWFTVNRWVTDEWLYPAEQVSELLPQFNLEGANGDPLVNRWITAMVQLSRPQITELLLQRDAELKQHDPSGANRDVEITSLTPIDLEALLGSESG